MSDTNEKISKLKTKSKLYAILGVILIILGTILSLFVIGLIPLGFGIWILNKSFKYKEQVHATELSNAQAVAEAEKNQLSFALSAAQEEKEQLSAMITPEMEDAYSLKQLRKELKKDTEALQHKKDELSKDIESKKEKIIVMDDELLMQSFGLYEPKYDFANAEEYRSALEKVRSLQKELVRNKEAATGNSDWKVNGSSAQGKKMVNDTTKLLLRAFNSECDTVIEKVKYNNFESALKRISTAREAISKLGSIMDIAITQKYFDAKIDELTLAFEYRQKKQEEKELQQELRAQMREEAKLQKEIEAERKKIEKEQQHYQNAMNMLIAQIDAAEGEEKSALIAKKEELENQLQDINKAMADIDYREANQRAGYVYIISNIGSFGENIFKIGMTRRLDPTERVTELGDASVPFNFDIHAMIFSDDAPALEAALHRAFEDRKLNMVNTRREFFRVSLEEIKEVVKKNFDKTVEFIDIPDAEQYRVSQKIRKEANF